MLFVALPRLSCHCSDRMASVVLEVPQALAVQAGVQGFSLRIAESLEATERCRLPAKERSKLMIRRLLLLNSIIISQVVPRGNLRPIAVDSLTSSICGMVTDRSGSAVSGYVTAFDLRIVDGRERLIERCSAETSKNGSYLCPNLPAGSYLAVFNPHHPVGKAPSASLDNSGGNAASFDFYPGATDLASALSIDLKEGDTATADFGLGPTVGVHIRGSIPADPKDAEFTLYCRSRGGEVNTGAYFGYSPLSGVFDASGVPPGSYRLSVRWYSLGTEYASTQDLFVGSRDVVGVAVTAIWNASIGGRVVVADGQTNAVHRLILYSKDSNIPDQSADVKANGTLKFASVPPASYVLMISGGGAACVASIVINGRYQAGPDLEVPPGPAGLSLVVNAVRCSGMIQGSIDLGDIDPDRVLIVVESEGSGVTIALQADHLGKFRVGDIPSGRYRVFAWPSDSNVEYRNPHFLEGYRAYCTEVSVVDGELEDDLQVLLLPLPSSRSGMEWTGRL